MHVVCFDLEGVLMPEVWHNVAEKTGIEALRRTTRDEPDYDKLMRYRLDILNENGITIDDIQQVIATMEPLPGAKAFLDAVRARWQVLILSDTFYQFGEPMMVTLDRPTLYCHDLQINDETRMISGWSIRLEDQKRVTVEGLRAMNFKTIAIGDSYNDTNMLAEAHAGILFRPPQNVIDEFPQFPVVTDYAELMARIEAAASATGE
ncbi:TPA: bifunctional phosphoserine phosphatase/homoserine phosphotransferase ThrH [Candidatus Thalassarchaeaceae archaeon]|jgi:phosphoserine/homoserine phosphotransferase|nr:MAG TPA: bifunctional phosphoserine phosphatase/homoserine phosphotransferase ThrH [Candidatus Poseidoniales archaeon]HII43316.1 bifunctional phosphoserine phosphatase/homoserine phosphotransferase ThrH [Candidatus Thalassarchaeaceae archaeon]|tara:strand:+ start:1019 stop:1636 length:618 start_codon:yes stop_codon:yes gene_type:complete